MKPQNVLVDEEGEVKVTDFGIARSLDVEHGVTQTGTVMGTSNYLSPEQASGKPVTPATDVYSLGIVLWELLTGDVPFPGENFVAVALRHINEQPPDLRELRPDVSPRLAAAVERALAKTPEQRFARCRPSRRASRLPRRARPRTDRRMPCPGACAPRRRAAPAQTTASVAAGSSPVLAALLAAAGAPLRCSASAAPAARRRQQLRTAAATREPST